MTEAETRSFDCQACGAALTIEAFELTTQCPYCDSPAVIERPPSADRPEPRFVLGFRLVQEKARAAVKQFIRRKIFARSDFRKAPIDKVRGVYLPAYLYSAVARSSWAAEIGENYTVTETYTTTNSEGKRVTRTRTKVKTEWRSLSGEHATYLADVLVTASRSIPNAELEAIEPFELGTLGRYQPAMIAGWPAEDASLGVDEGADQARSEAMDLLGGKLAAFMPGDSHRGLRYTTDFSDEVCDLALLPVWVFAVRYAADQPPVRLLVNGQTGRTWGKVPLSWRKILLTVLGVIGLGVGIFFLVQGM